MLFAVTVPPVDILPVARMPVTAAPFTVMGPGDTIDAAVKVPPEDRDELTVMLDDTCTVVVTLRDPAFN